MLLKRIYKKLTALHWEIGLLDNTYEEIVEGKPLKFRLVTHDFPKSWFADPFILSVSDNAIEVLVEEVIEPDPKGHISKLTIDSETCKVVDKKIVLERPGHLSFPVVVRRNGKVYVYPENSEDGSLNIYEYNAETETLDLLKELCDKPLTDAIYTELLGGKDLFTTDTNAPNGYKLDHYKWNEQCERFEYAKSYEFDEHIARMAGEFFEIEGKVYRPAQESNNIYGHGMSIQRVDTKGENISFEEVRRLDSPYNAMTKGFHTLNSYKGVMVVDVKGYRHKIIGPIISKLRDLI